MDFLHRVEAVVILDEGGERVFAKYYTGEDAPESAKALASVEKQRLLERSIQTALHSTQRSFRSSGEGDIMLVDGHAVLFQTGEDITFIVIANESENELVLLSVLRALVEALRLELNTTELDMLQLLERYDALLLTVDELLDEGIVLETNAVTIAGEVEPFLAETGGESARKALTTVNKYLRDNL